MSDVRIFSPVMLGGGAAIAQAISRYRKVPRSAFFLRKLSLLTKKV